MVAGQTTLFGAPRAKAMSRAVDPLTSHLAAHRLVKSGRLREKQVAILEAVRKHPGLTARELARKMVEDDGSCCKTCGHSMKEHGYYDDAHKRLPELLAEGMVVKAGRRVCAVSGEVVETWTSIDTVAPDTAGGTHASVN